jgi:hypothetical protein
MPPGKREPVEPMEKRKLCHPGRREEIENVLLMSFL